MKNATPDQESSALYIKPDTSTTKEGKLDSMLRRFAAGESYHRFSAEVVGDHCLPTTISCLQRIHSLTFSRKSIKVKNRFGSDSTVKLYWLEGKERATALAIVNARTGDKAA